MLFRGIIVLKLAFGVFLTFFCLFTLLYFMGLIVKPNLKKSHKVYTQSEIEAAHDNRDVTFKESERPVIWREVDYRDGLSSSWYPRAESPILADLVSQGELAPVEERVGPEPLVMEGVDGIGKYGGTWMRVANAPSDVFTTMQSRMSGASLVRWSPLGDPIVPHIAKEWSISPDNKVWTFFLRKGMRWSDGFPFTAADIMYSLEEEIPYALGGTGSILKIQDQYGEIELVDNYTVKFVFPIPHPTFLLRLAGTYNFCAPKHYLKKYHPVLGDSELIEKTMMMLNISTRHGLYSRLKDHRNPSHPRLWPWVYSDQNTDGPQAFTMNPYFWAVDTNGNQLPYIDRVIFQVKTSQFIPLTAASGSLSMQTRHIRFEDYTLLMSQREKFGYEVYHWFPASRSVWALWPNLNRRTEQNDPISIHKHRLLNEKQFRQALSLAINRSAIIDAEYNGVGEPAQISPGRESYFHNEKLHNSYTAHNPNVANRILDEIGLTGRDREGYRTFKDGTRMVWFIDYTTFTGPGPVQFIVNDFKEIGIRAVQRERARQLFFVEQWARKHDFTVWTGESDFDPMVGPASYAPVSFGSHYAWGFENWYRDGGLYGNPDATLKGGIEPPIGHPLRREMEIFGEARLVSERVEQRNIIEEALNIAADNLWSINIATPPPQLVIVKNSFKNVPANALYGVRYATPSNSGIETFYFEETPRNSQISRQIKREIIETLSLPDIVQSDFNENAETAQWSWYKLRHLVFGIMFVLVIILSVKHSYIGRRVLITIPTLIVISFLSFLVIQLPPSNYLESKMMQAEMTGEETIIDEVEQLKELFPMEESFLKRYMDWLGLNWFKTFDSRDRGLLQGHLGYSMESRKTVNEVVTERFLLTVLISSSTILLTWIIALPIGIYSAIKQYSVGDYIFTFIGMVGMCIPNFLLAVLLMYWGGEYFGIDMTGLYSPEYAIQVDWTWAKLIDLLKHIWVPIVVLSTGSTAVMIRVMRGNLLDELKKPYVITAMAKGVRPLPLLLKYPVRLALNPFISGIGSYFPQLISGGAIVAMVLSLSTVGPLMLQALLSEDMYLAGSLLMVLSLLGVFGTLVSDLLLFWLDPRIQE